MKGAIGSARHRRSFETQVVKKAEKLTVLVLAGGIGAEREVSIASGAAVAGALRSGGHHVLEADIHPSDLSALEGADFDIIFPALHGAFGEDGQLQHILERRRMRYAGSDALSSNLAMDKHVAKQRFRQAGLVTPDWVLIGATERDWAGLARRALESVDLPCVVKPNCQGSSVGVVIVSDEAAAVEAVGATVAQYGDCLVEQFVSGRELTVGILGGKALPVLEVRTRRDFYDYQAKYADDQTEYLFDIELPSDTLLSVQADAERAFAALGCRDFGRADMILDERQRDNILEINTIPGFTDHSLLPKAAAAAGLTMAQMCDEIVRMALARSI